MPVQKRSVQTSFPNEEPQEVDQPASQRANVLRRGFLGGGAALFGGLAGSLFGYEKHDTLSQLSHKIQGLPPIPTAEFISEAAEIREAQRRQTLETVKQLKGKYEGPILGKARVWDLVEKLGMCVDASDDSLLMTSQYTHVQQILEGMERDGMKLDHADDRDLFLVALLHDVGKVMLLNDEAPEHVVGFTSPVGEFPSGAGLDNIVLQFGHDELIYSRLKDIVPEHIAWTIRYHSISTGEVERYFNAADKAKYDRYLSKFHPYDQGMKSYTHVPRVDMAKYRALIEDTFPQPILF
jgi:hypothetical protein